jgi:spermidine synthase
LWCGTFYRAGLASQFLDQERSFFGVHRVLLSQDKRFVLLAHGSTTHSVQRAEGQPNRLEPLLYYSRQGPLGDALRAANARSKAMRVAVVGLGGGGVAAYIRPGDQWDFYEIDPKVAAIARDSRLFTYWQNAPSPPRLILGDARLQLKSAAYGAYDVILLDAYSSDTVPVHLLTREALALYTSKLAPDGVIVWHISNGHFDLEPVVGQLARDAGLFGLTRKDENLAPKLLEQRIAPSQWAVLARDSKDVGWKTPPRGWKTLRTDAPLWTDEKSSLWDLMVRKWTG